MTLDQRVDKLLSELYPPAMFTAAVTEAMRPVLRRALIEQDKITRHAAADDAMSVFADYGKDGSVWPDGMASAVDAAVMNCKGGVE